MLGERALCTVRAFKSTHRLEVAQIYRIVCTIGCIHNLGARMSVVEEVNSARLDIRTDDYQMSIGEWISLYESGDLDIHPEFQRLFRWSDEQKSNLVESILLGIPLPTIFVSQRVDGVWDVIDGLQRLSTILQMVGVLKNEAGGIIQPLVLKRTKYLPSLDGLGWATANSLPDDLKRIIRRSKLGVSIILRESDEKTKYDLFERLNTGGTKLTDQEVRNCVLVMVDRTFYEWLDALAKSPAFVETTALSERLISERYDMELALRYLLMSGANVDELRSVGDVGAYLGDKMVDLARDQHFDRDAAAADFIRVFEAIKEQMGDGAFRRYSAAKARHEGAFLVSMFEAVSAGVRERLRLGLPVEQISTLSADLWTKDEFTDFARSGVTAARRLWRIIPFSRGHFSI